jgi:hypothetical protein
MCEINDEIAVLMDFLNTPLNSGNGIFERFKSIDGYIYRKGYKPLQEFLYIRGYRENKVLLVAHVDTYWDEQYRNNRNIIPQIIREGNVIKSGSNEYGIGADDRAGCAMLWLLRESGHSLLLINGEECGRIGSSWLMEDRGNKDIALEIQNNHQFIIQLDRRNARDFKCYFVGTDEFRQYVMDMTGYTEPDRSSGTDIVTLCRKITGVNLSVGYKNEHSRDEELNIDHWLHTLSLVRKWISNPNLPRFER